MNRIIVSLTSYGERIKVVHKVVESLKKQTFKADKIILWLDETELTREELPISISELEDALFEVCFCPNYKSYKKLIPTLVRYPNSTIITFDDDILIPPNTVSAFVGAANVYSDTIIAARGRLMSADVNGDFSNYTSWSLLDNESVMSAKHCIIPIGYGGVLYPPGSLNENILDMNSFTHLADNADDIWFKCMALLNQTPVLLLPKSITKDYKTIDKTQDTALYLTVNTDDRNRKCLDEIALQYPKLKSIFCSDEFNEINVDSVFLEKLLTNPNLFSNKKSAVDFFISTALKIENDHTKVAFQLMSLAKKCRPKGPLINRKLSKYKQKLKEELQNGNDAPVICIIGCFRSGTNYLKTLLENNFECEAKFNGYGWKHGVIPITNKSQETKITCDLTFNITKNPYSFLVSMYDYASNLNLNVKANTDNFSDFLKSKFVVYDGSESNVELRFSNPIEYWNSIVWNHNSNKEIIHIQYEELIKSASFDFFKQLPRFNLIPKTDGFFTPDFKVKRMNDASKYSDVNKHETKQAFKSDNYSEHRYLSKYTKDDFDFVLNIVDDDLIVQLGYELLIQKLKSQAELKLEG